MMLKDISPRDAALLTHTEMVLMDDTDQQLASIKEQHALTMARSMTWWRQRRSSSVIQAGGGPTPLVMVRQSRSCAE
jgi:hypothetical protein